MSEKLVYHLIYSEFDEKYGPMPKHSVPEDIDRDLQLSVSMKSINLLSEDELIGAQALALIPFPTNAKKGIVRAVEWSDEKLRGNIGTGSITLLIDEVDDLIFYKYIRDFEVLFNETVEEIATLRETKAEESAIKGSLKILYQNIAKLLHDLSKQEVLILEETEAFPQEDDDVKVVSEFTYKIAVCGDPACGKTSSILRFTDNAFRRTYLPTMGVNITKKLIKIDNKDVGLVLWDIAGQAKFERMRKYFYEGTKAALLLFDLTRPDTLNSIPAWYNDVLKYMPDKKKIMAILCGNKNDLVDHRKVTQEQALEVAEKYNLDYLETSALTGENINDSFINLCKKLLDISQHKKPEVKFY